MGFTSNYNLLIIFFSTLLSFLIYPSSIEATNIFRPKALILNIRKDAPTNQYRIALPQRTPLVLRNFTLDLGGQSLWLDCDDYVSSSYRPVRCGSPECSLSGSNSCVTRPGCNDNNCALLAYNTVTNTASNGLVGVDVIGIVSTGGTTFGPLVYVPKFIFTCVSTSLLEGLDDNVLGMAGFGRSPISLPSQFSSAFSIDNKFAICLTSSTDTNSRGVLFIGDSPYVLLPNNIDFSKYLNYTPMIQNPTLSSDYFIAVECIKINGKNVPLNKKLLEIDENGYGGTKISTVDPYTVMETSIYLYFVNVFDKELGRELPRAVEAVAPFGACFNSSYIAYTAVGRAVPDIEIELQSGVIWRILGANSMVQVTFNVFCLGFVDGGINPRTSIVIGGLQLENNLVQFDVERSRVGFSGTLLDRQTTCENFNFTSVP